MLAFLNMSPNSENGKTLLTLETPEDSEPVLKWNLTAFNEDGKTLIPIRRFPASENCMLCHETSEKDAGFMVLVKR